MKKILVASDGSAPAERAVGLATELASAVAADLHIVTVSVPIVDGDLARFSMMEHESAMDILEAEANRILARARSLAEGRGIKRVKVCRETGEPAAMILEYARAAKADAIVVGKRGRGSLVGLLLGSVSQKLVSLAPEVVIVVP